MSFKCYDCGHVFEDGEQSYWSESRGEFWGSSCAEEMSGCPKCNGEYGEAVPCQVCGLDFLEEELNSFVCDSCVEKYAKDLDMCFRIGAGDTEKVEINCLLASVFKKEEIEELLFEKLKEKNQYMKEYVQMDCETFANADRSWFGDRLLEELEKEKK